MVSRKNKFPTVALGEGDLEFITPRAAIDIVRERADTEFEAKQEIADALRSGRVRSCADYLWSSDYGDLYEKWVPRRRKGFTYLTRSEVPDFIYRDSRRWPADINHWRWDEAEFVILESGEDEEPLLRTYLKGVGIARADIEKLVRPADRTGMGGRPINTVAWTAFWLAVVELALNGELPDFDTQQAFRSRILEMIGDQLSDETIKDPVRQIWNKFKKNKGF